MLTHIVIWKYRRRYQQATREEHVERLRSLRSVVPGIESLSVGFDTVICRAHTTLDWWQSFAIAGCWTPTPFIQITLRSPSLVAASAIWLPQSILRTEGSAGILPRFTGIFRVLRTREQGCCEPPTEMSVAPL